MANATKQATKLESVAPTEGRQKLTTRKLDVTKASPGFTWKGKWVGLVEGAPFKDVDKKTGEVVEKALMHAIFEDDKGERLSVIADKGLQGAISEAMLSVGREYEFVKLEKAQISKGRSINQYDIYAI